MRYAAVLRDFRSLPPPHRGHQQQTLEWLAEAHGRAELARRGPLEPVEREELLRRMRRLVLRMGSASDRVAFRSSALVDFTHTDWTKMRIFSEAEDPAGAGSEARTRFYAEVGEEAFQQLYPPPEPAPAVLVHVTCTGYVAPSGAQRLVERRGWGTSTEVLHVYHMGCYASLPGIRIAASLLSAGKARVDLVHTELCTLHMDPTRHTAEHLMVQSLFADGLIRYSVVSPQGFEQIAAHGEVALELLATHEEIVPGTAAEMGWLSSDHGMLMSISREVPERIQPALPPFLEKLAQNAGSVARELRERAVFAVHPGGPRIIDQVQQALGLRAEQVAVSNAVLAEHGNMSSATLPHVWQAIAADGCTAGGEHVVALAFGPGLTLSGAVLRVRRAP
jgi:predicted naringenin-chalcone synthase